MTTYTILYRPSPNWDLGSRAYGINADGAVVGLYQNLKGVHGFSYWGGHYTTLDDPHAKGITQAFGINDKNEIVGYYQDSDFIQHGFIDLDGVYTTVNAPGGQTTELGSLNNKGEIIGSDSLSGGRIQSFLYKNGHFAFIVDPLGHKLIK